tara:strand:- start:1254 stop:1874 length:621 start_codon:yes stop_codon:yes gene_type:complete
MAQTFSLPSATTSISSGRTNWNDALTALQTSFSGASAPSSTAAGMFWFDTNANILYQRNEANDAWMALWDITNGIIQTCCINYTFTAAPAAYGTESYRIIMKAPYNLTILSASLVSTQTTSGSGASKRWKSGLRNLTESGGTDITSADLDTNSTEFTALTPQAYSLNSSNTDIALNDVIGFSIETDGTPTSMENYDWTIQINYTRR